MDGFATNAGRVGAELDLGVMQVLGFRGWGQKWKRYMVYRTGRPLPCR